MSKRLSRKASDVDGKQEQYSVPGTKGRVLQGEAVIKLLSQSDTGDQLEFTEVTDNLNRSIFSGVVRIKSDQIWVKNLKEVKFSTIIFIF